MANAAAAAAVFRCRPLWRSGTEATWDILQLLIPPFSVLAALCWLLLDGGAQKLELL